MANDYSKLRGRVVEKYGTMSEFARVLGVTIQAVSAKLAGKHGFTQATIMEWADMLDIPADEIHLYFFATKVKGV